MKKLHLFLLSIVALVGVHAYALSLAPPNTLGEAVANMDALSDWNRDFGGQDPTLPYNLPLDFTGLGTGYFWPLADTSQSSMWLYVNGAFLYGSSFSNYFYIDALDSWAYNSPGTSWFYVIDGGGWFDLQDGLPADSL